MLLLDLLQQLDPSTSVPVSDNIEITGVEEDSRRVRPGNLFIARAGTRTDGAQFIADAIARRAAAIITTSRRSDCSIPQVVVKDAGAAASVLANASFGYPSHI